MLRAREAIQRGEIIGILGDRAVAGDRHVAVPFLGRDAGFPTGPIIVAALLGAPVLFVRGVCTGPRRYDVRFEPFAERIVLRREHRAEDLREAVARFARSLEAACLAHPTQWFNFYPFWKPSTDAVDHPSARDPAGHAAGGPGSAAQAQDTGWAGPFTLALLARNLAAVPERGGGASPRSAASPP